MTDDLPFHYPEEAVAVGNGAKGIKPAKGNDPERARRGKSSARLARATPISLSSVFLEVPEAMLPSAMFCRPLRAACTIWSCVRERLSMKRSQKRTVAS